MLSAHTLHFFSVGNHHPRFVDEGVAEYSRNLGKFCQVNWHLVKAPRSGPDLAGSRKMEGERLLQQVSKISQPFVIALRQDARTASTADFSRSLETWMDRSLHLAFLVGGPYGFDEVVVGPRADAWLSLSPMTFNHQLVRLILLEQVFRALSLRYGMNYHH